jgi:hypothetical protein
MKRRWVICLTLVGSLALGMAAPETSVTKHVRPLVGVSYFAGWWDAMPNKWHGPDGRDWRPAWPQRVPLLGEYNTQETMDREITAAAGHGVDFFAILWYYSDPAHEPEPHCSLLNRGLEQFLASPAAPRMKFIVEFCNHPPYEVTTQPQWRDCITSWMPAFRHPSCLRVGNRIVFKVHSGGMFLKQNGGDLERARKQLGELREAVRQAGLGEMLIGCGIGGGERIAAGDPRTQLFDFTGCYMDVPPLPVEASDYPYEALSTQTRQWRRVHSGDALPHMPYVPAGWNPRPWGDPRPAFALPDRVQWERALRDVAEDLRTVPNLGLPLADGTFQPAFTIYAWNEFGEGGIVAPTRGQGEMKLDGIRAVFD